MRVFYSWQSDTPPKNGHYFIRDALQQAIDELATDLELEEAERPELDHDTKGLQGAPAIAAAILEKIDACDVFVADVSLVGATTDDKKLINSNVAIELGYALKAKGYEALLLVMNTDCGPGEELPFDLKHRRWPTQFSLSNDADKAARAAAMKKLVGALKPILKSYMDAHREAENQPPEAVGTPAEFAAVATTISPAHYFDPDEELVPEDRERGWAALTCPYKSLLYIRMHPEIAVPQLPEKQAATLLWEHQIAPLHTGGDGHSNDRNRYGGIIYSSDRKSRFVWSATQLFRSKEIWGVDASVMAGSIKDDRSGDMLQVISGRACEEIIAYGVKSYLKFAREVLDYPLPVMVEVGASNAEGYYMGGVVRYFDPHWGPVYRDHIQKRCVLEDWGNEAVNEILLSIFEEFFDAIGRGRPDNLHGFPPAQDVEQPHQ